MNIPNDQPYFVHRSPRGAVVVCRAHIVTEEVKEEEALALVRSLNEEHKKRLTA